MHEYVFGNLTKFVQKKQFFIYVRKADSTMDWTLTNQLFWAFILLLCLPDLICYNPIFYAELTCHSRPTYPDILLQLRLNLRPLWHAACDVHSGKTQKDPLWSWLAVETSIPSPQSSGYHTSSPDTWHYHSTASFLKLQQRKKTNFFIFFFTEPPVQILPKFTLSRLKTSASL